MGDVFSLASSTLARSIFNQKWVVWTLKNDHSPLLAMGSAEADITSSETDPPRASGCWLLKGVGVTEEL